MGKGDELGKRKAYAAAGMVDTVGMIGIKGLKDASGVDGRESGTIVGYGEKRHILPDVKGKSDAIASISASVVQEINQG